MKFAHFADIHLGFEQYNQSWRAEDFSKAFVGGVEKAIHENVDFVIIAGDLFHRSIPNPRTIKEAIEALSKFKKRGIPVFAVEGNHDKSVRDLSIYHLLESLGLMYVLGIRKKRVESEYVRSVRINDGVYLVKGVVEGVEIVGDRHRTSWQLERVLPLLKPESDENILVLHQSVKEVVDIELNMAYELTLSDLPAASYYAFGHIHIPKVYELDGTFIVYPGSIERYDIREASHIVSYESQGGPVIREGLKKGFYIVEDFNPRFVEVKSRNLYSVSIEAESREEVEEKLSEVLRMTGNEDILIGKVRCGESVDIKKLTDIVLKGVRYAELRYEVVRREVERVEIRKENEFFTDFELKILELLREDDEAMRSSAVEMIKEYFGITKKESVKTGDVVGADKVEVDKVETSSEEMSGEKKKKDRDEVEIGEIRKAEKEGAERKKEKGITLLDFIEER